MSSGTFSIGIDWEYYENKENGLFVEPKYDNLKDEVLQYKYFDIKLYESELLPKADNYRTSTKIKCMKSKYDYKDDYGILQNEVISIDRLMCIILYTDYSNLSSGFTSTFRRNNRFEPLQAIKKRHKNYYWMARLLRETVTVYGQRGHGDFDTETDETINKLSGPFFCGMNAVMNLPQFNIYLLSPTSTTVQITVATKFGGYSGIIIEFGNDRGNAEYVPGLDVSYISRFHEEDERYGCLHTFLCREYRLNLVLFRLFYGYRDEGLNIISIRIIENHLNLKTTISAITALDNILTNNVDDHHKISGDQSYGRIISHLFDYALTDNPSNQQFPMHPYIYDTFKCFANHKTKIDIQLHNINNYVEDRKLLDLLFHSLVKEEVTSNNEYVEVRNRQNLLKGYLLKIFKNVEEINITASSSVPDYGKFVYPFSILLLLNVIDDTKINKFKINVDRNTDLNVIGWLGSIEKSKLVTSIVRMYKERGYGIKVNKGFFGYLDLVITKKSVYR